ncbi:MAG: hypothetical protein AAGA62_17280, partial [Bacteroidota bacterium]
PAASGGNAARELEGILAVQAFTLDKDDGDAKAAVGELLRAGALDKDLLKDLQREVALESLPQEEITNDPFQQTSLDAELSEAQSTVQERPVDGPLGYHELSTSWQRILQNQDVDEAITLLQKGIPGDFPDFGRQASDIVNSIGENDSTVKYFSAEDDSRYLDKEVVARVESLLSEIRYSEAKWVSEDDFTGTYTAKQTVDRMIQTDRLTEAVAYLRKLTENDFPEFERQREELHERWKTYLQLQSPPERPATKMAQQQTNAPSGGAGFNLAKLALVGDIEKLANDIDQVRLQSSSEQLLANAQQAARPTQRVTAADLEAYFLPSEETTEQPPEKVKVDRPVWWPILAVASGLLIFLLFTFFYQFHHSTSLFNWAENGSNLFIKEIPLEDDAIIF